MLGNGSGIFILFAIVVGFTRLIPLTAQQEQRDRNLIIAIRKEDGARALVLLQQRANPNARLCMDKPPKPVKTRYRWIDDSGHLHQGQHVENGIWLTPLLALYEIHHYPWLNSNVVSNRLMPENLSLLKALLERSADVNARDDNGETALTHAAWVGYVDSVRLLLERGADIHAGGDAALQWASCGGGPEVTRLLLEHGANPNARDRNGTTPLMLWSGGFQSEDTVRLLLARGARVNTQNRAGYTALMWAAGRGHNEVVKMLLARGADVNARTKQGQTALGLAGFYPEVVTLLKQAGARE